MSIIQKKSKLLTCPKGWVSGFLSVDRNEISASAIMKKSKNGCHFININHTEKFQNTDLPKFGSPVFRVLQKQSISIIHYDPRPKIWVPGFWSVDRNGISALAIMKTQKMALMSLISIVQKHSKLLTRPKFGLWFSEC